MKRAGSRASSARARSLAERDIGLSASTSTYKEGRPRDVETRMRSPSSYALRPCRRVDLWDSRTAVMHAGRQLAAAAPPPRLGYDNDKTGTPSSPSAAGRVLLGLTMGMLVGALLGSIGSAALWTFQANRNGLPSSLLRSFQDKSGHCQETLSGLTQRWGKLLFEETRELDWACDGKVQQLKTDAKEALEQLRNDSAASNSTSLAASTDVLDCERVLEDLRVTPALAPEDLVNGDTGIQSLGILTEGQKAAHTFLQEGRAPLHATPKGLLLGHGYDGGADLSMMELVDCAKTDVLLLEPDRCYALVGSETYVPAGSIAEFELVEGSVPWRRRPQRDAAASVPPTLPAMEAHEGLLRRLFHALPEIDALLEPLVADAVPEGPLDFELLSDLPEGPTGAGLTVVLVAGKGQHQALLDQACAKQELMGVENQGRILVFAEDETTAALARAMGYKRVATHPVFSRSEKIGNSLAEEQAHTAWLRLLAAWLMIRRGADVLIHGVEFVWLRHWSQALTDGGALDSWRHDFAFMPADDSDAASSDEAGAPFHPHPQGLWHVHANLRSLHFFQRVLFQQDYALLQGDAAASAAATVMAQVMEDMVQCINLRLLRLSPLDFPSSSRWRRPGAFAFGGLVTGDKLRKGGPQACCGGQKGIWVGKD